MDETNKSALIDLVQDRPALWDQKSPEYNSRMREKNKMWQNIAKSLNVDVELVKKTWSNLRDYFRKELKNVPLKTTRMPVVDKYNSKWPYWKPLLFLVPILHSRPTEGNLNLIEELVVEQDKENKLDLVTVGPTASDAETLSGNLSAQKKACTRIELEQGRLAILKKQVALKEDEQDPDLLFLKSLLPEMKKAKRVMGLKIRLLETIQNYLRYDDDDD